MEWRSTPIPFQTDLVGRRARHRSRLENRLGMIISAWLQPPSLDPSLPYRTGITVLWKDGTASNCMLSDVDLEYEFGDFDEDDSLPPAELASPLSAHETAALRTLITQEDCHTTGPGTWFWAKSIAAEAGVPFAVFEHLRRRAVVECKGDGDSLEVRPSSFTRRIMANPRNLTECVSPDPATRETTDPLADSLAVLETIRKLAAVQIASYGVDARLSTTDEQVAKRRHSMLVVFEGIRRRAKRALRMLERTTPKKRSDG